MMHQEKKRWWYANIVNNCLKDKGRRRIIAHYSKVQSVVYGKSSFYGTAKTELHLFVVENTLLMQYWYILFMLDFRSVSKESWRYSRSLISDRAYAQMSLFWGVSGGRRPLTTSDDLPTPNSCRRQICSEWKLRRSPVLEPRPHTDRFSLSLICLVFLVNLFGFNFSCFFSFYI